MGRIYITTNLLNGKVYIGRDCNKWNGYLGGGVYFRNTVKKYGKENFRRVILEDNIEDNDLINAREKYWIAFFNSTDKAIGYNITKGGDGAFGLIHPPEIRAKMSTSTMGRIITQETRDKLSKFNKGKTLTQEHKDKIGKKSKGRLHTQEAKNKMSKAMIGKRVGILNSNYGKHPTQETRDKMSKAKLAYYQKRRELAQNIDKMADLV